MLLLINANAHLYYQLTIKKTKINKKKTVKAGRPPKQVVALVSEVS